MPTPAIRFRGKSNSLAILMNIELNLRFGYEEGVYCSPEEKFFFHFIDVSHHFIAMEA